MAWFRWGKPIEVKVDPPAKSAISQLLERARREDPGDYERCPRCKEPLFGRAYGVPIKDADEYIGVVMGMSYGYGSYVPNLGCACQPTLGCEYCGKRPTDKLPGQSCPGCGAKLKIMQLPPEDQQ